MRPQIASFQLVPLLSRCPPLCLLRSRPAIVYFSSSPQYRHPPPPPPPPRQQPHLQKRSKGSFAHTDKAMLSHPPGFNKRRAEGRDKPDKPKSLDKKLRKLNPINTISYVQILGTGMDTQDTSSSVLLFFDHQRFIFNAGEGLQRFCTEHKIKLSKIDHIFLSRVSSETAGGLPGLLLTLAAEVGLCVNIWGPSDLDLLVKAMKLFIPNAAMVHTKSFGPLQGSGESATWDEKQFADPLVLIDDEVVKISAILLCPKPLMESGEENNGETLLPGELSVVYVFELPDIQGKFDPQKAKALGLKPGPKYRELQLNKSVKSDSLDKLIHPSDVMDPPIPGPTVLLVDCPTKSHLQQLSSSKSLNAYYASPSIHPSESAKKVNCVIHLSPSSVIKTSLYQEWMSRLGDVQHIFAGHERKNAKIPILKSSARVAARLNFLCPQFFPASGIGHISSISSIHSNSSDEDLHGISAENLMKFHLRPYTQLGLDLSCTPCYKSHEAIIHELLEEIPEIEDAAEQVKSLWTDMNEGRTNEIAAKNSDLVGMKEPDDLPKCLKNITREDMEITLLGTGSSQPSKYRNVSSIFINLFTKGSLLFDCGEGTLAQLKRRFGLEGADIAVRNLRCIWISHIHADHHTGLARILALRQVLLKGTPHEPLIVIGPRQLKGYLDAYQRLEDLDFKFLDCSNTTRDAWAVFEKAESDPVQDPTVSTQTSVDEQVVFGKGNRMQSIFRRHIDVKVSFPILKKLKKTLAEAGLEPLVSFPVIHCPQAYGVVLKASERLNSFGEVIPGWSTVYSGDTRPCPELIEASRGATVLIHEATFEDSMVEEAIAKNHSTTNEAIQAGEAAGVYRIILTHFSQRYPKIPVLDDTHMHDTCIAFDLMSINMADLPVLPKVLPYLKLLFKDEMLVQDEESHAQLIAEEQ